jgi:hypothetical protein
MMARGFAAILDECLAALSQGDTLEDCLARHPKHAEELRSHLVLAQRLAQIPQHEPRAAAQAGAWKEFRERADDMRQGRRPPISIDWLRPVAVAAAVVLAIVVAGGGTVYAAQDALPDSPLYRVKLAAEDARLWFVFDDSREAEILLDQSDERTDEIMKVIRADKPIPGNVLSTLQDRTARAVRILEDHRDEVGLLSRAREQSAAQESLLLALRGDVSDSAGDDYAGAVATLHNAQLRVLGLPGSVTPDDLAAGVMSIAGAAQPAGGGVWLLGGVEVRLDAATLGEKQFEAGQAVSVTAARAEDGQLLALNVTVTDRQKPEPNYVVSGVLENVDDDEVVIGGQPIKITERTLLKLRLLRGQQVEIEVEDVGGRAVAASVEGSAGDVTTDEVPALLAYEGVIEEDADLSNAGATDVVVGGESFIITPSTDIDATAGDLTEGAGARVEAIAEDGEFVAKSFVVLADAPAEDSVRVEGVLEDTSEDGWTVSGVDVEAPESEAPEVGTLVSLQGRRHEDTLVVDEVVATFHPDRGDPVLLQGDISKVGEDGIWRVGLAEVQIDEDTIVLGELREASRVFIWASRSDDDSLRAGYANVLKPRPTPKQASDVED